MKKIILIALVLCIYGINSNADNAIRLINWWEYLSKESVKSLEEIGYKIDVITYKSNEVAISQLIRNKNNIDIAIVSNQLIPALIKDNIIVTNSFENRNENSKYLDFFKSTKNHCIPYLWATTVFVLNTDKNNLPVPKTLKQLAELRNDDVKIAAIDDKFEILAHLVSENSTKCPLANDTFPFCDMKYLNKIEPILRPNEYNTSIAEAISQKNTAAYGWHGEVLEFIDNKNISISLPDGKPVISYDSVCIVKNNRTGKEQNRLVNFALHLGSRKNTEFNVRQTQYFSPFKDGLENNHLKPKNKKILSELIQKIQKNKTILISIPNAELHSQINTWWKNYRYANK